jgi:hypothetical protein
MVTRFVSILFMRLKIDCQLISRHHHVDVKAIPRISLELHS